MAKECIQSACPYCGVGCGVEVKPNGEIIGDVSHPANQGALCVKGSALAQSLDMPSRLLYPNVQGEQVSWQQVSELIADKLHQTIEQHGPDSVAMYVSGQLLTEDYYVANKLMKGYVGSANIDTNSRLCMSSAVAAHVRAFGEDIVPVDYEDIKHTDLIVLVGANTAWTHPILFRRIQQAREANPNVKLVVIDPRKTITAEQADLHLQIENDGDVSLFNGLVRYLIDTKAINSEFVQQHVNGFDALENEVNQPGYQLEALSKSLAVNINLLRTFYQWFADSQAAMTLFCQGVNQSQSGTDKANTIINAHLISGKIGSTGSGPFSLTGQPNAMGGREVGGLANQLAVHRGFDERSIQQVGEFWQAPNMATQPGLKAVDLFQAVEAGKVRFLWIMATNPAVSMPNSAQVRRALEQCDFVVVSDITSHTDTAQYADVLLPAAGWGEKQGMVTNSERCLTRQRQFIAPPGEAKPDWWMVSQVGKLLCQKVAVKSGFEFASEADVFREFAALTGINQATDLQLDLSSLSKMSDEQYHAWKPQSWPLGGQKVLRHKHTQQLHFPTQNGKANLIVAAKSAIQTQSNVKQSWWLNSGRQRDQWHTMTRTGHISHLCASEVEPTVYLNPISAEQHKLEPNSLVVIQQSNFQQTDFQKNNIEKALIARLSVDKGLSQQQAFMSMHWAGLFGGKSQVNLANDSLVDPHSGQPAFKSQWVNISAMPVVHYGFAIGLDCKQAPWAYKSLQHVDFSSARSTGLYQQGIWRFADVNAIEKQDIKALAQKLYPKSKCLTLDLQDSWLMLILVNQKVIGMVCVSNQPSELNIDSLQPLIREKFNLGRLLSVLSQQDGKASKLICSCFRVTEDDILKQLEKSPNMSLDSLQSVLSCGKNCGSCLPEVKGYLKQQPIAVTAIK
ncbi:molybdopterin-dependent oxidoreductase [Vibrio gangliei]|uniref:molybdopterin-dependent oxidoreductase n=1 Tax=Vibrio gangliei TaxID=2077090 RepID=UPI000D01F402|nr:molybdopterin-dependent oxidoreductase [Vibrio gangliei]